MKRTALPLVRECIQCRDPFVVRTNNVRCRKCQAERSRTYARTYRARLAETPPELSPEDKAILDAHPRPKTRGECVDGPRPCPWYGCKHHLGLDVSEAGTMRLVHDPETWIGPTCSLDVADRGPAMLREIGDLLGVVSRERARQIEARALRKLRRRGVDIQSLGDGAE